MSARPCGSGVIATLSAATGPAPGGGIQALQSARDPRVKTLVIHNGGLLVSQGPNPIPGLRGHARAAKRFVGERCGLRSDAQWSLQRKQFP